MTIERRLFILGALACGGAVSCGASPSLTVSAQGAPGINPGPDGADRPLTITVVQMRGTGAFDSADFFALQDPASALGPDFVKADQIVLTAGTPVSRTIPIQEGVAAVGIIAGFRDPGGKTYRLKTPAPSGAAGVILGVTPSGISLMST
jgi:type VI secretion system protein VasD